MDFTTARRAFVAFKRDEQRDGETIRQYEGHLERWEIWRAAHGYAAEVATVNEEEVAAFFRYLSREAVVDRGSRRGQAGLAPSTLRAYHRTCSTFWRWLRRRKAASGAYLLPITAAFVFERGSVPIPPPPNRVRPALGEEQYEALLAAAGDGCDEESARNIAILRMLWDSGARVHELAELLTGQLDLVEMEAAIVGKGQHGGKPGYLFWTPTTNAALRRYLQLRQGPREGPLFRGVNSRNRGQSCSPNLIRLMVKRLAKRAGIALPAGSPCHSFRHAFARRMRARGLSKAQVGELLRDETPEVINRYLGLDVEAKRALYRRANGLGARRIKKEVLQH